jgi:MFS family permease
MTFMYLIRLRGLFQVIFLHIPVGPGQVSPRLIAHLLPGFIIVWAKLSDIFGRKTFLTTALVLFLLFSGACGGAKTLLQL